MTFTTFIKWLIKFLSKFVINVDKAKITPLEIKKNIEKATDAEHKKEDKFIANCLKLIGSKEVTNLTKSLINLRKAFEEKIMPSINVLNSENLMVGKSIGTANTNEVLQKVACKLEMVKSPEELKSNILEDFTMEKIVEMQRKLHERVTELRNGKIGELINNIKNSNEGLREALRDYLPWKDEKHINNFCERLSDRNSSVIATMLADISMTIDYFKASGIELSDDDVTSIYADVFGVDPVDAIPIYDIIEGRAVPTKSVYNDIVSEIRGKTVSEAREMIMIKTIGAVHEYIEKRKGSTKEVRKTIEQHELLLKGIKVDR